MFMNFKGTWIILFLLTKRTILQNISQIEIYLLLPHGAYILSQNYKSCNLKNTKRQTQGPTRLCELFLLTVPIEEVARWQYIKQLR